MMYHLDCPTSHNFLFSMFLVCVDFWGDSLTGVGEQEESSSHSVVHTPSSRYSVKY